jgi:hypothetical protein
MMASFSSDAFFTDSFSPTAFDIGTPTPPPVVTMDFHDGDRDYHKRREQHASLRAMISEAVYGRAPTPVLAEVAKVVAPYRTPAKVDLTGVKEEVIAKLLALQAEHDRQIEDDDEEVLLMVLH